MANREQPAQTHHLVPENEAARWLSAYGISYPDHGVAGSAAAAATLAEQLGYPVVMKIASPDVAHKTEVGGVRVGLDDAEAVRAAFHEIRAAAAHCAPQARLDGVLVSRQAPPGMELIVGAFREEVFGPSVAVGLGGVWAEVLNDVVFRVAPIDRADARDMLCDLAAFPVLAGARGGSRLDLGALEAVIAGVSRMIADLPYVEEIDLNPVRVYETGALALDARILTSDLRSIDGFHQHPVRCVHRLAGR